MSNKSRAVAAILCFVLGMFGAHRFYVGKTGTAIVMLLLTVTILFWWVSAIWALIDFIIILIGNFQDKQGKLVFNWNDVPPEVK